MDETSGCGARRALNARERSGDATSANAHANTATIIARNRVEDVIIAFESNRILWMDDE